MSLNKCFLCNRAVESAIKEEYVSDSNNDWPGDGSPREVVSVICERCIKLREENAKKTPNCFVCGQKIKSAVKLDPGDDPWHAPCGILFRGGGNFGSGVHDSLVSRTLLELVVCDPCLQKNRDRCREVPTKVSIGGREI